MDDFQWLDDGSVQVLGFVARRLLAEHVAMVFAVREPSDRRELTSLPELWLGGLMAPDARALFTSAVAGPIDPGVRDRIITETRGNPLALLEMARGLNPRRACRRIRDARSHQRPPAAQRATGR